MYQRYFFSTFIYGIKKNERKRDKENPFLVINNHCFKNDRLSLKAKGFLCFIFSLPDDWSFSISGISVLVGESKKSVYKIIQELIDNGYCTKSQKKEAGKFCNIEYEFFEIPFNKDNEPFSQNPLSGFTHSEKGTQLNNNIINNSIEVNIYDDEEEEKGSINRNTRFAKEMKRRSTKKKTKTTDRSITNEFSRSIRTI